VGKVTTPVKSLSQQEQHFQFAHFTLSIAYAQIGFCGNEISIHSFTPKLGSVMTLDKISADYLASRATAHESVAPFFGVIGLSQVP